MLLYLKIIENFVDKNRPVDRLDDEWVKKSSKNDTFVKTFFSKLVKV